MASHPDITQQIADLQARLQAIEAGQVAVSAPAPDPKTTGLTFDQAAQHLKNGEKISRAAAPWQNNAYLVDAGLLPHWGLVVKGSAPKAWPGNSVSQAQIKLDLTARDWEVVE